MEKLLLFNLLWDFINSEDDSMYKRRIEARAAP